MYCINKSNGYIYSIVSGDHVTGDSVNEEAYKAVKAAIARIPTAPDGFGYRLKENLEWELYELPEAPDIGQEATEADYLEALARLGVESNA